MGKPIPPEVARQIADQVVGRNKLAAIKLYREHSGDGLKESVDFVEALETELQAKDRGSSAERKGDGKMKHECCPAFDPKPWDDKILTWTNKRFVKDRVTSFLHIPLNFGAVIVRNATAIEAAGAGTEPMVVLSDENSLWGADVYIEVTKDIPNAKMATLSGTFVSKVFEGPYQNVRKWVEEMKVFVAGKGKSFSKLYFYYTTCPKCAKKYGKNYVVILAQV